jgi:hypothetical protein
MCRGDAAVGDGLSIALLLGVAGEVLRGGGRNPRSRWEPAHARDLTRWSGAAAGGERG